MITYIYAIKFANDRTKEIFELKKEVPKSEANKGSRKTMSTTKLFKLFLSDEIKDSVTICLGTNGCIEKANFS
jgi:hypothetical protein